MTEDQAGTQQGLCVPAVGLEAGGSACTLWSCSEREGGKGPAYLPGCREWGPPGRRQGQINSLEQQRPQNSLFSLVFFQNYFLLMHQ